MTQKRMLENKDGVQQMENGQFGLFFSFDYVFEHKKRSYITMKRWDLTIGTAPSNKLAEGATERRNPFC